MSLQVTRWTVDYGEGQVREVRVPHAWRQEVDVRWEGPAVYKTLVDIPVRLCGARESTHNKINADIGSPDDPGTKALFEFVDEALKK